MRIPVTVYETITWATTPEGVGFEANTDLTQKELTNIGGQLYLKYVIGGEA